MSDFLINFHFLRPLWLLLLLLPLLGCKHLFTRLKTSSSWVGVCDENLLGYLLVKGGSGQRSVISYLGMAGFVAAIIAISGPTWHKKEVPVYVPENPVMVLLSLSTDMEQNDVTPNRLSRAKYGIADMAELLGNIQLGLAVYSNEPFLITPFTEDSKIISNLLRAVDVDIMPENGDRLNRAIDFAVSKMKDSGYLKGNIVVFSSDVGQDFNSAIKSAQIAASEGYKVSVVEVSSSTNEKLKMIADKGAGIYTKISEQGMIKVVSHINDNQYQELKLSGNEQEMWLDYGYYLVVFPLLCCLYFFRRGILVVMFIVLFSNNAMAGFFLNSNQEGLKAFNNDDYVVSAEKFKDSSWKGAAYYRMGYYDKAYKYFSEKYDAESLYNQGNALAKSGKIEEAIAKYEEVLEQVPEHEDAKFNLEYLRQQNQQDQQQNQNNEDKEDQQNQESNSDKNNDEQNNQEKQQNQEQNQSGDDEQDQEKNSKQQQQSSEDNQEDNVDESEKTQEDKAPVPNDEKEEKDEKAASANMDKNNENEQKYDEEVQAREQQYRDIPEDIGGLLREFIKKEYNKNRYKD